VLTVCSRYDDWVEDWWNDNIADIAAGINGNFRDSSAYARGRQDAALQSSEGREASELRSSQRPIIWQLNQIFEEARKHQLNAEGMEQLAQTISDAVAQRLSVAPHYIAESYEEMLRTDYGHEFDAMPLPVRRLLRLAQVEVTRHLAHPDATAAAKLHHLRLVCRRERPPLSSSSRFHWTSLLGHRPLSWMSVKSGQAHTTALPERLYCAPSSFALEMFSLCAPTPVSHHALGNRRRPWIRRSSVSSFF
jgi:hypothetical protein